jgi:hypothetical protein
MKDCVMGQPEDYIIEEDNQPINSLVAFKQKQKLYRDKEKGMMVARFSRSWSLFWN